MGLLPKDRDLTAPIEEVELAVDASDFRVKASELVVRLDQFLGERLHWRSRSSVQRLVREGYVYVDASTPDHPHGTGTAALERRPGRRLRHGSRVVVVVPEENRVTVAPDAAGSLEVLYEDREVLVVDKPPLIAVHPSGRHLTDTLIQRVHHAFKAEIEAGRMVPRLCHRLDRETSGIVLVGKSPRTQPRIMRQFERHTVEKSYLAITRGAPPEGRTTIDEPIGPARASAIRLKMAVRADGQASRTDVELLERRGPYALVRCDLHTGRQHQIRVHLAWLGCPVVGDKLYGADEGLFSRAATDELSAQDRSLLELDRHALHHARLTFTSPDGNRRVTVESPLAPDLAALLGPR